MARSIGGSVELPVQPNGEVTGGRRRISVEQEEYRTKQANGNQTQATQNRLQYEDNSDANVNAEDYTQNTEEGVGEDNSGLRSGSGNDFEHKPPKKSKAPIIILIIALVAVGGFLAWYFFLDKATLSDQDKNELLQTGTYHTGLTMMDVDLAGKTLTQAQAEVEQKVQEIFDGIEISYVVNNETYTLDATQLGASMDILPKLEEAMLFGREGSKYEIKSETDDIAELGVDMAAPEIVFDEQAIAAAVNANDSAFYEGATDATAELVLTSDEDAMIVDYEVVYTDGASGFGVDKDKLIADIYAEVSSGSFNTIETVETEIEPEITKEDLESTYAVMGSYETEFESSAWGRRYNIWKMADIINGVTVQPGETWSINEEAGPRTYALGWEAAPGISNGVYVDEPGGGICQVSSTLYNAVINSEVEVAEKTHHSWPLAYVPGGLDATISTGGPDFKITNNYDVPIHLVATVDGEEARTVEVAILGPAREDGLTIEHTSELVETFGGGQTITIPDPNQPTTYTQTLIGEHLGKKYEITKNYYDADGNLVKSEVLEDLETYAYKPAQVVVGTRPW